MVWKGRSILSTAGLSDPQPPQTHTNTTTSTSKKKKEEVKYFEYFGPINCLSAFKFMSKHTWGFTFGSDCFWAH